MSYRFRERSVLDYEECCFLPFEYKGDSSFNLNKIRNSQLENVVLQAHIKACPRLHVEKTVVKTHSQCVTQSPKIIRYSN